MTTSFGAFGPPPDAVSGAALAVGLALFAWTAYRNRSDPLQSLSNVTTVLALATLAALLSAGYVAYYLRGGPRIIDATSYYLEARAFSEGHVRTIVPAPLPTGSFRGRFLLGSDDGRGLAVIFPPGYPVVLALGFLVKAPMLVGPIIAAALVVVTYGLAKRLFGDESVARLAAALSALCAVLRCHTADTMSHGLAALLFAVALWAWLGGRATSWVFAGAAAGALVATRPVSGALCLLLVAAARPDEPRARMRRAPWVAAGVLPPILAFVLEQRLATGRWLESTQAAYYAVADGPPGCFRYGFGDGIGCHFEHGDFVRAHLTRGFGAVAALGTTLRRLKMHLADAGNVELFAPVLVYAIARSLSKGKGRVAAMGVIGIVAAYAPFYFDGNYPGGGARFFADVLPLEHALIAWVLVELRASRFAAPVALLGFALHTANDHRQFADRDGARPMFESAVLERTGLSRGLVFVSTDHGFNLGFDPRSFERSDRWIVARRRHDAYDRSLWEALGRPPAYDYSFDAGAALESPALTRLDLAGENADRFEAESEWPPLSVSGGSVEPVFPPCASRGRALWITPLAGGPGAVVRLSVPGIAASRIRIGWVGKGPRTVADFVLGGAARHLESGLVGCGVTGGLEPASNTASVEVRAETEIGIDFVELESPRG